MKKIILLAICCLLFISCHKKIITKNNDYEGNWTGTSGFYDFTINIDSKSNFDYSRIRSGGNNDHISGTARLGKSYIHVGIHQFLIIKPPSKINSTQWQMEIQSPGGYTVYYNK